MEMLSYSLPLPTFSTRNSQNAFAVLGEDLYLHCHVESLGFHTVSWVRQRDLKILTVGSHKFTTSNRISVKHNPRTKDFTLLIRQAREEDLGTYECQINTIPVKIRVVTVEVDKRKSNNKDSEPASAGSGDEKKKTPVDVPENSGSSTSIIGSPDIYFQPGSLVNITCVVKSLNQPENIFWYHNGEVVSYYSARGGISIIRKIMPRETMSASSLILKEAGEEDQGTYVCRPVTGDFKTAKTRLFIGQGAVSDASISHAKQVMNYDFKFQLVFFCFTIFHSICHR